SARRGGDSPEEDQGTSKRRRAARTISSSPGLTVTANRFEFWRLLWRLWSPTWQFAPETYARSALSFGNPDFVDVVIQSYRHRYGYVVGDPALEHIEALLAHQPPISVPTIVLDGADDGVSAVQVTDPAAPHFSGRYERR